jgi:hypothetical protein
MSDIVKRLQAPAYWISGSNEGHEGENDAPREAADTITRLTAENEKLRAYALKAFTVVEFCCGEGFLLSYPHYDCDDLTMEGVDLLKVESSEEARAALSGDKQ